MSQSAAAPTGIASMGSSVSSPSGSYNVGGAGSPTVPADVGKFQTVMKGMQNMLGKTPEERETNAKALAASVKDINSLVGSMSESTLMQRMMEAQGQGLGFLEGSPGAGNIPLPQPTAIGGPLVNQLGIR